MTDNFGFTEGSGKEGAAKDIGGVLYPKVIATEIDGTDTGLAAKVGSLTETAPSTDTSSSGLNGRLQRIAQRLTTLIGSTLNVAVTNASIAVTGTFWQATQPTSIADGSHVTFGAKADAKSAATDTTAISAMSVWKQISASVQAIASAIAGTLTVSGTVNANIGTSGSLALDATLTGGSQKTKLVDSGGTNVASVSAAGAVKTDGSGVTQPVSIAATVTTSAAAATSGGATPYKLNSAASTNATSVKNSAGTLYGIQVYNTNASARYLKLYNKASAPTVGTDTPVKVITIPGNANGSGSNVPVAACGVAFSTGIAFALTTGAADSDTGAVAANEIIVNLDYK